jgi:MFS family permease
VGRSIEGRFTVPTFRQLALHSAVTVDALGTGAFVPVSLLYFTCVAGLPLALVGVLTTAGAIASLPVPVVAGRLADRHGPRAVVVAGQLLQALGFAGFLLARAPITVFGAIALVAVGQRLFWSSLFTLVAAMPGDASPARRFAVTGMLQSAGAGIGVLAAGALLAVNSPDTYRLLAVANAGSFLMAAALTWLATEPVASPERRGSWPDHAYLLLTAVNAAFCLCSVFLGVALPVYLADGLHAAGWIVAPILGVNIALLATGQLLAVRAVRRLTRARALTVAGLLWTVWALLTAAATAIPGAVLVAYLIGVTTLYAAAELIHAPMANALAAEAAPPHARGTHLAVFQYGFTVATIVAPAGFTLLFAVDRHLPWLALATLAGAATLTLPRLARSLGQ